MEHRATASSRSSCRATAALRIISREATSLATISASLNCRYCSERREENQTHRQAQRATSNRAASKGPQAPQRMCLVKF